MACGGGEVPSNWEANRIEQNEEVSSFNLFYYAPFTKLFIGPKGWLRTLNLNRKTIVKHLEQTTLTSIR